MSVNSILMTQAMLQLQLGLLAGCAIALPFACFIRRLAAARTAKRLAAENKTYALMLRQRDDGWPWHEEGSAVLPIAAATGMCMLAVLAITAAMLPQPLSATQHAAAEQPFHEEFRPRIDAAVSAAARRTMPAPQALEGTDGPFSQRQESEQASLPPNIYLDESGESADDPAGGHAWSPRPHPDEPVARVEAPAARVHPDAPLVARAEGQRISVPQPQSSPQDLIGRSVQARQ